MAYRQMAGVLLMAAAAGALAQSTVTVKPKEISDVLVNPGIGFTTFQRFNGDALNPLKPGKGWTEGFPIEYQPYHGDLANKNYPQTSIAYFRVYWRFIEPAQGVYDWSLIDRALRTAHERGQTLMLRVPPYGTSPKGDVPDWYRANTGEKLRLPRPKTTWKSTTEKWMIDAENPAYAREYGAMIRALGERYDGDPDLELMDISVVGAWGEDAGSELLSGPVGEAVLDAYLESFHKTPLVTQLADPKTVAYTMAGARGGAGDSAAAEERAASLGTERPRIGWRADCLGDLGEFTPTENLMEDHYPEDIIRLGLADAWKTAPVSMEACGVLQGWKDRGWSLAEIAAAAVKWHVSSFNAKSSPVPAEWTPEVKRWLNRMGYRFVLRRFTYPAVVDGSRKLAFTSWWENEGNAPAYRDYRVALRLVGGGSPLVLVAGGDVRGWLPGDNLYNDAVFVPWDVGDGEYELEIALVDPGTREPRVRLAIAGRGADGWYPLGKIRVGK